MVDASTTGAAAPCHVRLEPVPRSDAPSITRDEARKPVLRHRRDQVVTDAPLMLEELGRHHRTDGVASDVFDAGVAAPVAVEPGHRIGSAHLDFATQDVPFTHAYEYPGS